MNKSIKLDFANTHQMFLENQTKAHCQYLDFNYLLSQKALQHSVKEKSSHSLLKTTNQHKFLFDPVKENWIMDHCPTFTRPSLAMTSIVDIMASQCEAYFPNKKLILITDVRLSQWAIMDKPKMITVEVTRIDASTAEATMFLQKDTEQARIAKGKFIFSDSYPQPIPLPAPIEPKIEFVTNPYSYLPHGPVFQTIHSLAFGRDGSSMLLEAHNPLGPTGCLNHILLDGATQGVPNENGLSFWHEDLPDNHVCYPALLKNMNIFSNTPVSGKVRCETRFAGFHFSKTLPVFHMYLSVDNKIWCKFELVYALLSMGFITKGIDKNKRHVTDFIKNRCYTPGFHLADLFSSSAILNIETMQNALKAQWFPHLVEDVYDINADIDIHSLTQNVLVKDYFSNLLRLHPSEIQIFDNYTVANKNAIDKLYHYTIHFNANEYLLEYHAGNKNA